MIARMVPNPPAVLRQRVGAAVWPRSSPLLRLIRSIHFQHEVAEKAPILSRCYARLKLLPTNPSVCENCRRSYGTLPQFQLNHTPRVMSEAKTNGATPTLSARYAGLQINAERTMGMIEASCAWGSTPDGGMNRLSCNDDDKRVRDWLIEETKKCGCEIKVDQMGNTFAIRPGENNSLSPIGLGSHLDTQPTGGRYDGILGVISALEVLKTIHANNITTYAPLAVVNWTNEEGARFPPAMLASGVWGGEFSVEYGHSRPDNEGKTTLGQELERIGYKGDVPCSYDANPLLSHFEVHIEQGPELDGAEEAVAVVKGVQSMCWYHINVVGREAHTGTTPMDRRSDALLGAARMICETNRLVTEGELAARGARATIAVINSGQSINTVAGKVHMSLDVRAPSDEDVAEVERLCRGTFQRIAEAAGLRVTVDRFWNSPALHFDPTMVSCVRESAQAIGCKLELVSGAGHDSVYTSRKCPTAMIFVRCRDGVSHNPAEYSRPQDCSAGAQTLLGAYLRYDDYVRSRHTTNN